MTTTATVSAPDLDQVAQELDRKVLFVSITVHMWRGQRKAEDADVKVGEDVLPDDLRTDPRYKLMPKVWASRFTEVEGRIRRLVDEHTPRNTEVATLPLRGIDIIPRKEAKAFFDKIRELEDKVFQPLVDQFCAEWPQLVADLKNRLLNEEKKPELWERTARLLPATPAEVRRKFRIEKRVIPISFDTKIALLDGQDAEEFVDEVQKGISEFARATALTIVTGLQTELNEAVDNLTNRILDKGVIKSGTLNMVKLAFEKIRGFEFAATPELKKRIHEVQQQLDELDHTDLNRDLRHDAGAVAAQLASSLKELRAQTAAEAKALRGFGRQARALEL